MTAIQFDQAMLILATALAASAIGGVCATTLIVIVLLRRQGVASRAMEATHAAEMDKLNQEHAREKSALRGRIAALEDQLAMLVNLLQARKVLSSGDAVQITANRSDQVYFAMRELFSRGDLEILAHEIGINIEDVAGDEALPVTALRLLQEAEHTGRYGDLVSAIRRARPNAALN